LKLNSISRLAKVLFCGLVVAAFLAAPAANSQTAASQSSPTTQNNAPGATSNTSVDRMDEPETKKEVEAFRHSTPVQKIAQMTHMDTETTAKIFEDLNSAILIGAILWFLLRVVPKMLRSRSENLQKQLMEARVATAQANERLSAVEERLSKLGIEIDAIREQTERESAADEKRIQEALESERQRIVASAEQEIDAAGAAARRDLKKFAAELAVDRALRGIHLSADDDRALIRNFAEDLKGERN
jgi:F-type H+-transporting ATPase subunit b